MGRMSEGYAYDAADMSAGSTELTAVSTRLDGQVDTLGVTPDAGASSDEVSKAFAGLATGLAGLAQGLTDLATGVTSSLSNYEAREDEVASHLGGMTP